MTQKPVLEILDSILRCRVDCGGSNCDVMVIEILVDVYRKMGFFE